MFGVENDYFEILGRVQKMENVRPYLTEVALKMNAGMEEERSNTTKNVIREGEAVHSGQFSRSGSVGGEDLPPSAYEPGVFFNDV